MRSAPAPPFRLFTLTFAWGYVGLRQAIQIDSIRYAIDRAVRAHRLSAAQGRWALLSLVQAVSCSASTPGHFAQYLRGDTPRSLGRVVLQRRRDVWGQFLGEASRLRGYGTPDWRATNRVFRSDALQIWKALRRASFANGVVYADPPYSKDHYSRYYHVLETLVRYDYPDASGVGRYRPDRFTTPFSLKTRVHAAFDTLCEGVAATGSFLVLSYPSNGLLSTSPGGPLRTIMSRHFAFVELSFTHTTRHSTLGARHGRANNPVDELVFMAYPARPAYRRPLRGTIQTGEG